MKNERLTVSVFWSWQDDSPSIVNRKFILKCLQDAAKRLTKLSANVVEIDRDTKGVGGSPSIPDTILAKIRQADVFVYDATLAYTAPRLAPNPNVMLELGYALAVLGERRVIAVMNCPTGLAPGDMPFHLRHRRFPFRYDLAERADSVWVSGVKSAGLDPWPSLTKARDELVPLLAKAIETCMLEPKERYGFGIVDSRIAERLWSALDSASMQKWYDECGGEQQFVQPDKLRKFEEYLRLTALPEQSYSHAELDEAHSRLVGRIKSYLTTIATYMTPHGPQRILTVNVKTVGHTSNYEERLERELEMISSASLAVWNAWGQYVRVLREFLPSIIGEA